jgi:hypothetical protein
VALTGQEMMRLFICVLWVNIFPLSTIFGWMMSFQQSNIPRSSMELIDEYGIRVTQMLSDLPPNKSNTMMSLVEQELLVFPTFKPAVGNVQSLVFCSIFCL